MPIAILKKTAPILVIILLTALPLGSTETGLGPENSDDIRISADRMVAHGQEGSVEFTGQVRATSDDFDITADKLKIFYEKNKAGTQKPGLSRSTFREIIATGQVIIRSAGKIAKTEKAVYNKSQNRITLTGEGSRVTSKEGFISGETIIMYTDSEDVTVESGRQQRVKAVINAGNNNGDDSGQDTPRP